jgi:hypothetical protein
MTPNEEGRFCAACEKTVVDLTRMTQPQMVSIFEEKNGDMCGRMLVAKPKRTHKAFAGVQQILQGKLRKFAIALMAALGFFSISADKVFAQGQMLRGKIAYTITAEVSVYVEAGGNAVPHAQVQLKNGRVVIAEQLTDANGIASFTGIEMGDYDLVVRWMNEKMASRSVSLQDRFNDQQDFYFEKENGRWKEMETISEEMIALGGMVAPDPVDYIEVKGDVARVEAEPVLPDSEQIIKGLMMVDPFLLEAVPDDTAHTEDEAENVVQESNVASSIEVSVYPNPMEGKFFTQIHGTAKGATVSLMVFDVKGQVLRKETHEGGGDLYLEVDLSDQAAGVYFVKVIHGGQMIEKRVVKM